jgi:FAD:protein FMN transferase
MQLWGFRNESNELSRLPSNDDIATTLKVVGCEQIELTSETARLRTAGAKIDLGGIAVGFALDRMAQKLKAHGIEHAFIDISGDMLALGTPEGKGGWEVAIPDPNDTRKIIYKTQISNEALATSGNYMSFVTYQAQKFGHIMDAREGRSAHRVLSATVIAKTGMEADALSTASFVTADKYEDTKLVLVGIDGKLRRK